MNSTVLMVCEVCCNMWLPFSYEINRQSSVPLQKHILCILTALWYLRPRTIAYEVSSVCVLCGWCCQRVIYGAFNSCRSVCSTWLFVFILYTRKFKTRRPSKPNSLVTELSDTDWRPLSPVAEAFPCQTASLCLVFIDYSWRTNLSVTPLKLCVLP